MVLTLLSPLLWLVSLTEGVFLSPESGPVSDAICMLFFRTHQSAHVQHSIAEVCAPQAVWNTVALDVPRTALLPWMMFGLGKKE